MGTTFAELKRQVFLRLKRTDGLAELAIEEGINSAQRYIARVEDFEELMILDLTHAFTVASQKLYHLITDLALDRPKDLYTIRYMDGPNSRKLMSIPLGRLDSSIPYPEQVGTSRPKWYTRRGMYLEFYPIPNDAKPLYIQYSQWPDTLALDLDETPYLYLDDVITTLATEIAEAILTGGAISDWTKRAQMLIGSALMEVRAKPDVLLVAQPFRTGGGVLSGEYWNNPFVKGDR